MTNHRNRAGKHRAAQRSAVAGVTLTALTALVVTTFGGAGVALADPVQPGVSTEGVQPGVATEGVQPGVTAPPAAPVAPPVQETVPVTWVPSPVEYQQPYQPRPGWDYETGNYDNSQDPVAPQVNVADLHLPVPVETATAPIAPPPEMGAFGNFIFKKPNWWTTDTLNRVSGQSAVWLAQTTDFYRSTGIPLDTAQQMAASQFTAGAVGLTAGLAASTPVLATTTAIGAGIGGNIGLALGNALIPIPGVGSVPGTVVGAVAGGVAGAVVAAPVVIASGAVGTAIGVGVGTAFGEGENGRETEVVIPDIDQPAITTETQNVLDSWSASPPVGTAAADGVRNAAAAAPAIDTQIRETVSALPGGEGAVAAFDQAVTDIAVATAVPGLPISMISDAIGAGIPA